MKASDIQRFQRRLLGWYDRYKRPMPWRETGDPYAIWVSEVMLQQTRVEAVIPYYQRFMDAFPCPLDLAQAPTDLVLKLWEGLGYYSRARNLQKAVREVVERHGGVVPDDPERFRSLPGVGPYIAAAVQSIAYGVPLAAVDGNVKRVIARLELREEPFNEARALKVYQGLADELLHRRRPGDHNQGMMELGARVCLPGTADCATCPVSDYCRAHQTHRAAEFPRRIVKKQIPTRSIAVGVVRKRDRLLICRRREDGLLGGLWEFPGGGVEQGETSKAACVREIREEVKLNVTVESFLTKVTHAYSHFRMEMDVFLCRFVSGRVQLNGPVDFAWVRPDDLSRYPFPGANNKFIPMLLSHLASEPD